MSNSDKATALAAIAGAALLFASAAWAAPYRPNADAVVIEQLSPAASALRQWREPRRAVANVTLDEALASARHYLELGQTWSDPRLYGYAQAALGSWWSADPAPPRLLVMRARILQFHHEFDASLAQLEPALRADPFDADAWLLFASIEQVRGNVRAARAACLKLLPIADPLVGATCTASTAALGGRSDQAEQLLANALVRPSQTSKAQRVWALTTLAEIRARRADSTGAEAAFQQALALTPDDVYTRAAYADLLLAQDRPREVRALLGGDPAQADATLLRVAIAAVRQHDPDAKALDDAFAERSDEARARADRTHLREQARFLLDVRGDAAAALALARTNFTIQREPADASILLESAIAAKDPAAAQPALDWVQQTGIDAPTLLSLAQRVRSGASR